MNLRRAPLLVALVALTVAAPATGASDKPRPRVICHTGASAEVSNPKLRPGRCLVLPGGASFSEGTNLGAIKWAFWGHKSARGTARALGFKRPYGRERVRIRLYRPRVDVCGGGLVLFTRMEITRFGKKRVIRPQACYGDD